MEKTFTFARKHIITPGGIGVLLLLTIIISGLLIWLPGGITFAANAAVQYADSHWNCTTAACTSKVPAGSAQPNFQCAEFVSRSLAAEGLIPGLTPNSPQSAYGSYKAKNGKTYDLLWVGASASGFTSLAGLYQYVTQNGVGTDIGKNISKAVPGDVAIYFVNDGHTAIFVQTGSDPLVDAHNNARYHVPNEYSAYTILHVKGSESVAPYWPTMQMGDTGSDVQSLQMMLNARGAKLTVDGDFGPNTLAAVKAFQAAKKLTVDGIVGPQTWSALIVTTQSGSRGVAVTALQQQLNAHGANLTVDGQFGPLTAAAVRSYQSSRKLTVNGTADLQTWESLLD
jgi:hypothetical protein